MAKDTFYFSHDYNARTDAKVKRIIAKHGMLGYGIFWSIVEDLYNNANALPTDYDSIAFDLRTDSEVVKSIVCDFDLFRFEKGHFGSISIERRLEERNKKSEKARESALYRWSQCERNANAEQPHSDSNAIKESKGKDIKESKEKKGNEKKEIVSDSEVLIYPTFDDFWNLYQKKADRGACEKKWNKLTQNEKEAAMAYIPDYKISTPDLKFRRNPETFLNNKTWENEIIKPTNGISAKQAADFTRNYNTFKQGYGHNEDGTGN